MSDAPRFAVRRLNWKSPVPGRYVRLPGWTDVATFDTAGEADADRRRREAVVRAAVSPFDCADSLFELTSLPAFMFADWLMDGGLEPPAPDAPFERWRQWWASSAGAMTDAERDRVWAGCDKLRFFDLAEQTGAVVHVVQEVHWGFDWDRYTWEAQFEGGRPLAAFRSAAAAESERRLSAAAVQARLQEEVEGYYPPPHVLSGSRAESGRDPFDEYQADEVEVAAGAEPFAETLPVVAAAPRDRLRTAGRLYLVHRVSWTWRVSGGAVYWIPHPDEAHPDGTPVAAFLSRKEAETLAWELDFADRLYLNPFRFGHPGDLSSVPEPGFRSILGDTRLSLPADDWSMQTRRRDRPQYDWEVYGPNLWEGWWSQTADVLSLAQRDAVWDLLDQLRFHQVIELVLHD